MMEWYDDDTGVKISLSEILIKQNGHFLSWHFGLGDDIIFSFGAVPRSLNQSTCVIIFMNILIRSSFHCIVIDEREIWANDEMSAADRYYLFLLNHTRWSDDQQDDLNVSGSTFISCWVLPDILQHKKLFFSPSWSYIFCARSWLLFYFRYCLLNQRNDFDYS